MNPPSRRLLPWLQAWARQLAFRLSRPEIVLGGVIAVTWAGVGAYQILAAPLVVVTALVISAGFHLTAILSGSHFWMWFTTGLVLALAGVAASSMMSSLGPTALCVAGLNAYGYSETVRFNHLRRRSAHILDGTSRQLISGFVVVAGVSVLGVGLAQSTSGGSLTSWWWWAAATTIVTVVAAATLIASAHGSAPLAKLPWEPGRQLPPPEGDLDPPQRA